MKQYADTQTRPYICASILYTLRKQRNKKADLWIMSNWKELLLNHSKELIFTSKRDTFVRNFLFKM
jgi:hypothetical protein